MADSGCVGIVVSLRIEGRGLDPMTGRYSVGVGSYFVAAMVVVD